MSIYTKGGGLGRPPLASLPFRSAAEDDLLAAHPADVLDSVVPDAPVSVCPQVRDEPALLPVRRRPDVDVAGLDAVLVTALRRARRANPADSGESPGDTELGRRSRR